MKVIKETNQLILYKSTTGDVLISIKIIDSKLSGAHVCDFCNADSILMYLCPELGYNAICENCFKEHSKDAKWYVEDMHPIFNTLIDFICNYDLSFTEEELDIVNEFFEEHSHRDKIDIRKFMEVLKHD